LDSSPEDIAAITGEDYVKPMSKGFPSVDTHNALLFQFTVSEVHGYKETGLRNVIDVIKRIDMEFTFELYLAVSPFVHDSVGSLAISKRKLKKI